MKLVIFIFVFISHCAYGQFNKNFKSKQYKDASKYVFHGYDSIQNKPKWTLDELSNITVYLYQPINDTVGKGGTGTLVMHNGSCYLLTASHVARELKNNATITFRVQNDRPYTLKLESLITNQSWTHHKVADVSLIQLIPPNKDAESRFSNWSFHSENIYNKEELIFKEFELHFLGYPIIDVNAEHFSPLTFSSHYASGLLTQNLKYLKSHVSVFYLDRPSIQGASGSPLYLSVEKGTTMGSIDRTLIIGIVSGNHSDDTGGKMAIIMPSYYIWDLLSN